MRVALTLGAHERSPDLRSADIIARFTCIVKYI